MGAGGLLQTYATELFITLALSSRQRANLYFALTGTLQEREKKENLRKVVKGLRAISCECFFLFFFVGPRP